VNDRAIKLLSQGGEARDNIPQRVDSAYRRQVNLVWPDGSRSEAAVFDYNGRLYQIEAKALPGKTDNSADIRYTRFEQSLVFTDDGSNRSEETIRALRQACPNTVGPPAGFDDPRCPGVVPR
jgi:hypothetical protein